ncbi:MAG: phosphotransferase [Lachnospiraceae bacterium]|jgi:aminoglycoside phosphotransferase (APT) family kinase protein|nr:phosphotransferase [Lachnospiraceae bacterium]
MVDNILQKYINQDNIKEILGIPCECLIILKEFKSGEYNQNFIFPHPVTDKKYVLRVNKGSQLHLDNQIEYEYNALSLLENTGRTPKVFFVDNSKKILDDGVLIMEYLPGEPLDYKSDLNIAAEILADIHSKAYEKLRENGFRENFFRNAELTKEFDGVIISKSPLNEIITECNKMFDIYRKSDIADKNVIKKIDEMFLRAAGIIFDSRELQKYKATIINTELNSSNFLINGIDKENYLIDWEKPLIGDPAMDMGHFLAPTTTNWKTDTILSTDEIHNFIRVYKEKVGDRLPLYNIEERTKLFISITCIRGLTWSAMALVEYLGKVDRPTHADTLEKIQSYLKYEYLDMILREYF